MKRIGWVAAPLLVFLALLFYRPILTCLASWSLQAYSAAKWGISFEYEEAFLQDHQLVLMKPQFEHHHSFIAEKIALDFDLNLWEGRLDVNIHVEQPNWRFDAPLHSQWKKFDTLFNRQHRWLKTHPHLHIKEGTITWLVHGSSDNVKFDLDFNHQEGGYLKLHFDRPDPQPQSLILQTVKTLDGFEVTCKCEHLHCVSLMSLADFLGIHLPCLIITEGNLQGEIKAIFPKMQRPYLEGDLLISHLAFHSLQHDIKAKIEEAQLTLSKNEKIDSLLPSYLPSIGKLEILKPAFLSYRSLTQEWQIHQMIGSIQFDDVETAVLNFKAEEGDVDSPCQWSLDGEAHLNPRRSLGLNLTLSFSKEEKPDGKIHLALNRLENGMKQIKLECEKLSYSECHLLQPLLATRWSMFNDVVFEEGLFNTSLEANLTNQGIGELAIKEFQASHVRFKVKPWTLCCEFAKVQGHGKINLQEENGWQSVNGALHLEDGTVRCENLLPPLPFTNIQAHLFVQEGQINHSLMTLQVAGLKGKMDIEWGDQKELVTFKLDGRVQDISDLFPDLLQEGIRKHFHHNRMIVLANLKKGPQQIELGGTLHIQRTEAVEETDLFHFGCEFKKIDDGKHFKYIPIGWFHAQKLPLEKYLSPFLFRNDILSLSGEGEFKGSFDDKFLSIKYDADHLKIENEDLCIEIPDVHAAIPGQFVGSHQLNLDTHAYQGTLPFHSASYFEKNTGLLFHDIEGLIRFENGLIRIHPIEATCEGLDFGGELELDYRDPAPGVFDLKLTCPSLSGNISNIQHLLARIAPPSLLYHLPLEGEISGKEHGLQLTFSFFPLDYHLKANIQGVINNGTLCLEGADMALKGIYSDIEYDHQHQLLTFSDIQGALLVGKPRRLEEYLFSSPSIRIHNKAEPNIEIDISVKDKGDELLRLVGRTEDEADGIKTLQLDSSLSHFSSIYPTTWKCQLRNGSNLEHLEFTSSFDFNHLLQDLNRFRHTGLFFVSHSIIDKIGTFLPLQAEGSLALNYRPDGSYSYLLEANHVKQGNSSEHFGLIKGSKQNKKWIIDQLQWDDWNAYGELLEMEDRWRIPSLGLKAGQTVLLGMDGEWLQEAGYLKAHLKFCQIDLSKLDDFSPFKSFAAKWWPKGILSLTGSIEWNLLAPHAMDECEVNLLGKVNNFTLRNCPLNVLNSFQIRFKPHDFIRLDNVRFELCDHAFLHLKAFNYRLPTESIQSLAASFQIPHQQLESVGEAFHHHFPEMLDNSAKEVIVCSKKQDHLQGRITVEESSSNQHLLHIHLEDGLYWFKNREYHLKEIQLDIFDDKLEFSASSQEEQLPFKIAGHAKKPSYEEGECCLTALGDLKPLVIKWINPPGKRLAIRSMEGDFSGCSFLLKENHSSLEESDWISLQGKVDIDFNKMSNILSPNIAETIRKLKIGSLYTLNGNVWLHPDKGPSLLQAISLKGSIASVDPIFKGYQMQKLDATIQYVPGRLDIQNLLIQDVAGNAKALNGVILNEESPHKWTFSIPRLSIRDLKPSLLRDTDNQSQGHSKFRSLIFKKIDLHNLTGDLEDIRTWKGSGYLQFFHSSRKNALHPLFAIPAEIILRLGLDPKVLNPVSGTIYFSLFGDRFYLNRFKDVFSEGKGSKFYLAGSDPSWVDFDGNLLVNVRMKQYNLIFKIAELFTVSIQGNIKKPTYNLQKQSKRSRKRGGFPIP